MPTEAQLQANRANAKKSCGPKTDDGKAKSRLNALKHGLRARPTIRFSPRKIRPNWKPRSRSGSTTISRPTPSSAISSPAPRGCRGPSTGPSGTRPPSCRSRFERPCSAPGPSERKRSASWPESCFTWRESGCSRTPARIGPTTRRPSSRGWKSRPRAAQWLLDRWVEMRCLLISDENWTFLDQFKFVRLLGKQPINAIDDPELNEIFLAWETIEDQWGTRFWLQMQELTPYEDPAFSAWRVWREIVPRPEIPRGRRRVSFEHRPARDRAASRSDRRPRRDRRRRRAGAGRASLVLRLRRRRAPPTFPDRPHPRTAADHRPAGETPRGRQKSDEGTQSASRQNAGPPADRPTAPSRSKPLSPKA